MVKLIEDQQSDMVHGRIVRNNKGDYAKEVANNIIAKGIRFVERDAREGCWKLTDRQTIENKIRKMLNRTSRRDVSDVAEVGRVVEDRPSSVAPPPRPPGP